MDIGFIGLGTMGAAIARNLLKAGHRLTVWNRSAAACETLAALGARQAASAAEACDAPIVFSMLADDQAVREVFIEQGALARMPVGTIHVNMATISMAFAKHFAALHRAAGREYVAAPVFGRAEVAAAGKLNILAAGAPAVLDRLQPLFDAVGQKTWRLGEAAEQANLVKIIGNFMIAASVEMLGEAMSLGLRNGIDERDLLEVLVGTILPAPLFKTYGGLIAGRSFDPAAFRLALGLKDVELALAAGRESAVPLPLASLLRDSHLDALAHGDGEKDWSALSQVSFRRAGLE
ncbi:NAD(P)-dependent oxidoreductase [Azospirillum sp. sgz302134]